MQVDVHHVEAHIARADGAEQRVHIRSVVVEQTTASVDQRRNLLDVFFKKAERVRVGHHDSGDVRTEQRLQRFHVHQSVRAGLDLHDFEAADRRRSGVGSVRAVRHYHLRAGGISAKQVVVAYDHKAGKFTVGAGARVQREALHTRDGSESLLRLVVNLERALHGALILQRMEALEGGHRGDFLVDLRVVLHGATAQRVEARIHTEVHLGEIGIVPDHVRLAHLRKNGSGRTLKAGRQFVKRSFTSVARKSIGNAAWFREFENQFIVVFHG